MKINIVTRINFKNHSKDLEMLAERYIFARDNKLLNVNEEEDF